MTQGEKSKLLGFRGPSEVKQPVPLEEENYDSVNWVTQGKVNAVQNQGQCGSCWAFATVAAVETAYAIKNGSLPKLSEQQLVDCSTRNYGCGGGWPGTAFQYLQSKSLNSESGYPYLSGTGYQYACQTSQEMGQVYVTDYQYVE